MQHANNERFLSFDSHTVEIEELIYRVDLRNFTGSQQAIYTLTKARLFWVHSFNDLVLPEELNGENENE